MRYNTSLVLHWSQEGYCLLRGAWRSALGRSCTAAVADSGCGAPRRRVDLYKYSIAALSGVVTDWLQSPLVVTV